MEFEIGIVCGQCDAYGPLGSVQCSACGHALEGAAVECRTPVSASREERMEQAKHYVCKECSTAVPSGHKFCGSCGAVVPAGIYRLQNDYFGSMQIPGMARLILIRGESGMDGLSYMLQGTEHVAGRVDGQILFPEDPWLSPRHANFFYENKRLVVRDEGSVNGIYLRIREPVKLAYGDQFLCGEQIFRVEAMPADEAAPDHEKTYFYGSPKHPATFRVVHVLRGGVDGTVVAARGKLLEIGREGVDLNFPEDLFMSAVHARLELDADGSLLLSDQGSKNGSFVRIREEQRLQHNDYLFLGKQLLRVEMTA